MRKEEEGESVGLYIRASHDSAVVTARYSPKELINRCIAVFWTPHRSLSLIGMIVFSSFWKHVDNERKF